MSQTAPLRPLSDLIDDLTLGLLASAFNGGGRLRPESLDVTLPVETRLDDGEGGLVLRTDLPRTRLRTDFDRPIGRLVIHIDAVKTP
jgi:hypothetical protein